MSNLILINILLILLVIDCVRIEYRGDSQTIIIQFSEFDDYNPFYFEYDYGYDYLNREIVDCFANKLVFTNGSVSFSPKYTGSCKTYDPELIRIQLDQRDYFGFINIGFATIPNPSLGLFTRNEDTILGNFPIQPISENSPLNVTSTNSDDEFYFSFADFFLGEGVLLLHFSTFVRLSSLNISLLTLRSSSRIMQSPSRILTGGDILNSAPNDVTIDVAIRLTDEDRVFMEENDICTNDDNCYVHFEPGFVHSFNQYQLRTYGTGHGTRNVFQTPKCKHCESYALCLMCIVANYQK